jgi:hypothetical protein
MSDTQTPVCPGCKSSDRVEPMGPRAYAWTPRDLLPDAADLTRWWCARCLGCLSALPALPAAGKPIGERFPFTEVEDPPLATGQGAKRGRKGLKGKEGAG